MTQFVISSHWNNVDPERDNADWWWVYMLSNRPDAAMFPTYVGMAKNLSRRLGEHRRTWTQPTAFAHAIAVATEAETRRLEAVLIAMLDPQANMSRPKLSWVEEQYFSDLGDRWQDDSVVLCPACRAVCEEQATGWFRPLTEPSDDCSLHVPRLQAAPQPPESEPDGELGLGLAVAEPDAEPTELVWTVTIPAEVPKAGIEHRLTELRAFPAGRRTWFIHESDEPTFEDDHAAALRSLGAQVSVERMATPGALRLVSGGLE